MTNKTPQPLSEEALREKIEDIVVDTELHPVDQSLRIMKLFIQERQAVVRQAQKNMANNLIDKEIKLYNIYGDDKMICVGIKTMADEVREYYE